MRKEVLWIRIGPPLLDPRRKGIHTRLTEGPFLLCRNGPWTGNEASAKKNDGARLSPFDAGKRQSWDDGEDWRTTRFVYNFPSFNEFALYTSHISDEGVRTIHNMPLMRETIDLACYHWYLFISSNEGVSKYGCCLINITSIACLCLRGIHLP